MPHTCHTYISWHTTTRTDVGADLGGMWQSAFATTGNLAFRPFENFDGCTA